ncbi:MULTISPECIES: glycosyltransferase [unclassified Polaribacter]|jgi:glycosyltransferase involved in cell wall biosynthesis|uniref:glycosyltransferase n=1 Tax=unclassified Polaribacter TaxID=196858 RepID=UPI001C4F9DD4|nr:MULTISPECIES: glycosyltransferase [unclassified Polaribacter]QXP63427.1 glycosyltransferase [Polaribacter sp. HaHaR_3_91]QXP65934.1 glycosyltransferase [Polaribacter sp. AHE13PA]QXP71420.1 glycosyltransferase [Polaribacter sp. R2A056_3_33]
MKIEKKILVMDWLDAYAGSEQVVKYLHQKYNFDKVYVLINIMPKENLKKIFGNKVIPIETTFLKIFGSKFRAALPLFPFFLKQLKVKEENALIISVTHSVVKGISYKKSSKHISYLVARNLKYVWEEKELYFKGIKKIGSFIIPSMRRFDIRMSKKPTVIISVSDFVSNWAIDKYKRKVYTINPPVNVDDFEYCEEKEDFYVSVGRLEPYKRYDLLIDAFNKNGKKLVIIGDGSLMKEFKDKANKNIEFKGYLFPEESKQLLKKAKAFVFCGKEDFGIALLEPQVCGTPVIAYGSGGALDTVLENKTGIFFREQTVASLTDAINKFESIKFNCKSIREHSLGFSIDNFKNKFHKKVIETLELD